MRHAEAPAAQRPDPLDTAAELPLRSVWYPLGFTLELSTNSADVVEAAGQAWCGAAEEFPRAPLVLRVLVSSDGALAGPGRHCKQGRLYSIVSDSENYAHVDLHSGFGFVRASQETASDHRWLRWFFLEAVVYTMLCQRDVVMLHAGCVARRDRGVLLCGASGTGKSTLSYACAREGWTWLADDCTCVLPHSGGRVAMGRSAVARFRPDAPSLFPELESYAIRARPTGTLGIEVPLDALPGLSIARRAEIATVVFLDRGPGAICIEPISHSDAVERLLADMPRYGPEVDPLHEEVVRSVAGRPAFRMRYESIADALTLLAAL